ncbi:HNH endonuclease signature motif containing protein [Corynebacterium freiburgense]|uniref:HNH endonuclease signature motif containing protein n=1 Tax=Corynebacterium freiburgense TaxID=556548 RepID=UPI00040A816B|nr:HNH endonuclease signature motif containing protein [Corynebacterium freiburgense]WJZ01376.1 HNH endonuclease [Corynebacterium freiburgense]
MGAKAINAIPVCFAIHDPKNLLGASEVVQNREFLSCYLLATHGVDAYATNMRELVKEFSAQSGLYSEERMNNIVGACFLLHHYLPQTKTLGLELGHLDYRMLRAIWQGVMIAPIAPEDTEIWAQLDAVLVEKLTPSLPNQALPTPTNIKRALQNELVRLGCYEDFEEAETGAVDFDSPDCIYGVELLATKNPSVSVLSVTMPADEAVEAKYTIELDAKEFKIRQDQVVSNRLCGEAKIREDVRQIRIIGVGQLTPTTTAELVEAETIGVLTPKQRERLMRSTHVHYSDANDVAKQCHDTHDPSIDQRVAVRLRDGNCRFPGCNVAARFCDIDHVINHEAGGWTTISNLQCLCRDHHNYKTDRNAKATSDIYGNITWQFGESLTISTKPMGPLAGHIAGMEQGIETRHSKRTKSDEHYDAPPIRNGFGRWGTTLASFREKQRDRHVEKMTERMYQLRDCNDIPRLTDKDMPINIEEDEDYYPDPLYPGPPDEYGLPY